MENFQSINKIYSCYSILSLFYFSSLFFPSTSYTLPDRYYINCGSSSSLTVNGRSFTGDENPGNYVLTLGKSKPIEDPILNADKLYRSARIFSKPYSYVLDLDLSGIYVVRFHFFPFLSLGNLSDARFNVLASSFSLLSNFNVENNNSLLIKEFLLQVPHQGKFRIEFVPYKKQSFAFVNAIEVILAPPRFIPDSALHVTQGGPDDEYYGVLNSPLQVVHRINVGGENITPNNDTMLRYWIPDDEYLFFKDTARNSQVYTDIPKYQSGGATEFDAPTFVYRTAKEMNINGDVNSINNFNISWRFDVRKRTDHLVRLHFCDIVSRTTNELFYFNLYIYSNFGQEMHPYDNVPRTAAPFYIDFVVYSDDSGFMNISVGPSSKSRDKTAFLNGVEIMELIRGRGLDPGESDSIRKHLLIIVGSSVGGVIVFLIILIVFVVGLRKRKSKVIEALDWTSVPRNQEGSGSRSTVDLELGLKVPFSEILFITKQFDPKLMIGEGGFGKVYKGTLRKGKKVAVKRSEPGHEQGLPEFQTEIMVLSKIHHNHLVSLIGYCNERNEMILVYEFMENGTLRDHLINSHGEAKSLDSRRTPFSWQQRLQICIGAAKGLCYLHSGPTGTIIHRDIKSTNILLDENYEAKVADFGLSRLGLLDQSHVSTEVKGSFGYMDPEYFRCFQLTQKSDVYSFGVVLLEVLCARPVIDPSLPTDQVSLAEWGLSCQRKGELEKIIDPFLEGKINPYSLRKFGETVEKCLQECGADRPNMDDVLWELEYCLQFQHSSIPRLPYEDSTTEVSWRLPLNQLQRFPSNSFAIEEDQSFTDASSEVYSLLKTNEAR